MVTIIKENLILLKNLLNHILGTNIWLYSSTIKMKPIDENSNTYIDSAAENNAKDPKFKFGDH